MIRLEVKHDLYDLGRALRREEDGKELRKDLVRNFKEAVAPAVNEAKASIRSMPSKGHAGLALRPAVAGSVAVQVKIGGRAVGVKVRARGTKVRGFTNAPRLLNSAKGWRHPNIGAQDRKGRPRRGQKEWVAQIGKPDWFDGPVRARRPEYRRAAIKAMDDMAERIARRH